jgi:hypothetical protein
LATTVPKAKGLDYVYPPITLMVFQVFTFMNYEIASQLFFALKCLGLILLLLIWNRYFVEKNTDSLFYLLCLLGFNCAIGSDLLAGNISIFEQLLIWTGFVALLRKKYALFGVLIVITALFKVVPILFLSLLLIQDFKKRYLYFSILLFIFILLMISTYFLSPALFANFLGNSLKMTDVGVVNPSSLSFIKDAMTTLAQGSGLIFPQWTEILLYMIIVVTILIISIRAFRIILQSALTDKKIVTLFFTCLVYALIVPRFKDYSYILLLVPAYYIIRKIKKLAVFPVLFAILILSSKRFVSLPGLEIVSKAFWAYYSLILTYFIWALYLYYIYIENNLAPNIIRNELVEGHQ